MTRGGEPSRQPMSSLTLCSGLLPPHGAVHGLPEDGLHRLVPHVPDALVWDEIRQALDQIERCRRQGKTCIGFEPGHEMTIFACAGQNGGCGMKTFFPTGMILVCLLVAPRVSSQSPKTAARPPPAKVHRPPIRRPRPPAKRPPALKPSPIKIPFPTTPARFQ